MVRSYKRKTERSSTPADIMFRAAKRVKCEHKSIRGTARDFAIPFRTLARYCKKITDEQLKGEDKAMLRVGYAAPRQVLSDDQEKELSTYLKQAADIYYGLSVKVVRKLAYQFAESASKTIPPSWKKHKMAGSDWFSGFLKRNKDLSIRSPETTSLSRAAGISPFNKDTFQGSDFLGAYVTDRPQEDQQETQVFQPAIYLSDNSDGNHTPQSLIATVQSKSCSVQNVSHLQDENEPRPSTSGLCGKKAPTPEELRPLHKAGPRKRSGMNRRKHSAAILTETPVKKTLEKISKEAKKKQPKKSKRVHGDRENSDEEDSLCLILAATRIPEKLTTMPPASGLQGRCKKRCPTCSAIIHVRKYICQCGHNFFAEKQYLKKTRDDQMQKAGNIASKNGNLWRAFDAIQKQSCKIRGGGYAIATLYYKECPTRNIKGIISGSALEADDKALLIDVFCKVAKSSKNKENEQKEDEQKGEKQSSVLNKSVAPSRNDDESKRPQVKLTEDVEVKYIIEEDPLVIKEEPYATEEELLVIEAEPFVIKEEPFVIKEEPHVIKEEPI